MSKKIFQIREYGFFYKEKHGIDSEWLSAEGNVMIPDEVFDYLEIFLLENNYDNDNFMDLSYKKGIGKIIKAKNYVGTIKTPSGITIEVLPKLYTNGVTSSYSDTKKILFKMLKEVKDLPFKNFNMANLEDVNTDILDIFIKMFLDEVSKLIKIGLKSYYVQQQDNSNYLKGKFLISKHIYFNSTRKDKFYVEYDEYSNNIPENKIIKATLLKLSKITDNTILQDRIRRYLAAFIDVETSINYSKDLSKCRNNKIMKDYINCIEWSKVFLDNKGFSIYNGKNSAYSLLYPMEKIFESYVGNSIKKNSIFNEFDVILQGENGNAKYLFDFPKRFKLVPDIIMKRAGETIILDTKWKRLFNNSNRNYGISNIDMYQMYAYSKKYTAKKIILIYPYSEETSNILKNRKSSYLEYSSKDGITVYVFFINIEHIDESLIELANILEKKFF